MGNGIYTNLVSVYHDGLPNESVNTVTLRMVNDLKADRNDEIKQNGGQHDIQIYQIYS